VDRIAHGTEIEGLRVVTSGMTPPNPVELLGSNRMQSVMRDLVASADVVIVDTPPTGPVSDAVILSRLVDGVLLVATTRRTRSAALRQSVEAVNRASARIIGVVLNVAGREAGQSYYGYKTQPVPAADGAFGVAKVRSADKSKA
jgi:protein-tyrosine kinase